VSEPNRSSVRTEPVQCPNRTGPNRTGPVSAPNRSSLVRPEPNRTEPTHYTTKKKKKKNLSSDWSFSFLFRKSTNGLGGILALHQYSIMSDDTTSTLS
jgi:hypothetical protein